MLKTQPTSGKYLVGMVASLIISLSGGWLILAPFALGYQPYGADWASQTTTDVATGIPVAAVGLIGFVAFFAALLGALRAAGVIAARPRPVAQAPGMFQPQPLATLVPATTQSDLDRTLSTLAAALAADLNARREPRSDQADTQLIEQRVPRRES